jgi:S-adenosylmethionine hydrolase
MIVTLLTDLGTGDAAVSMAGAVLTAHVPDVELVAISHGVVRDDVRQAAYLLKSAYKAFEPGAVHIVAVDVFCGEAPRMLMAKKDGYFFIAPDNGVLPLVFGSELDNLRSCYECSKPYSFKEWMNNAASVAATIGQGWVIPYPKTTVGNVPRLRPAQVTPFGIECSVLYIDRYRNVVLDLSRTQFERAAANRPFAIKFRKGPDVTSIASQYYEVAEEAPLCRFNSAGFMELCVNHGDAATLLGLDAVRPSDLRYQSVRIFF